MKRWISPTFKSLTPPSQRKKTMRRPSRTHANGFVFSIEGAHGVGKTSICSILNKEFESYSQIKFFPERLRATPPVPFGSKNLETAFRSELHYNQQMIQRNNQIIQFISNRREAIAILDRSHLSTLVYSRALSLEKVDYEIIYDTYRSVKWVDDIVLFLEASPKTIMNRIYSRGSLDLERKKWNEEDLNYLIRVIEKYNGLFQELGLTKKKRLYRISTENKTVHQVVGEVKIVIEQKTGLQFHEQILMAANQRKLTDWLV